MEDTSELHPMEFGELFGKGLDLMRRTMPTAGLISIGYGVLMCLITWWLLGDVSRMMMEIFRNASSGMHGAPHFPASLLVFYPLQFISSFVAYFIIAATLIASWEAINERDTTLGQVARSAIARPMWYMFIQNLVLGFAVGIAMMIVVFAAILLLVLLKVVALVILVPLFFLAILAVSAAIVFAPYEIVANGRGPVKSIKAGFELVRSNWGRVVAVLLVLGLISSVVMSIVAIPAIGPITTFVHEIIANVPSDGPMSQDVVAELMRDFMSTFPFWIVPVYILIGSILALYQRNVLMAAYVDLRARRGDFAVSEDEGLAMHE